MGKRKRHHPSDHELLIYATHEAGEHCSVTPKCNEHEGLKEPFEPSKLCHTKSEKSTCLFGTIIQLFQSPSLNGSVMKAGKNRLV